MSSMKTLRYDSTEYADSSDAMRLIDGSPSNVDDVCDRPMRETELRVLRACEYAELRRIECMEIGDTVVLRGRVSSYYLKQLAQEYVRSYRCESSIRNQLDVMVSD